MAKINKKMLAIVATGSGFEYYDFVIYALFVTAIGRQFFDNGNPVHATIMAVAVFASGYLARPLGGVLFGLFGDRYGRKPAFFASMLLMALATTVMGLMPGCATAGLAGTLVFVLARFLQGLSYGAEMPGAIVYVSESSERDNRSTACALMLTGACAGVTLATLVFWVLTRMMTAAALAEWGWRPAFLFGALLALVAMQFRRKLLETQDFCRRDTGYRETPDSWLANSGKIVAAIIVVMFPAAFVLLNTLFLPLYVNISGIKANAADIALLLFAGNLWCGVLLPFTGRLVDRFDRKKFFCVLLLLELFLNPVLFRLLHAHGMTGIISFVFVNQTLLALFAPSYMVFLPELFPVRFRLTAVGLVYNLAYSLASFIPAILVWQNEKQCAAFSGTMLFELLALCSLIACGLLIKPFFLMKKP